MGIVPLRDMVLLWSSAKVDALRSFAYFHSFRYRLDIIEGSLASFLPEVDRRSFWWAFSERGPLD